MVEDPVLVLPDAKYPDSSSWGGFSLSISAPGRIELNSEEEALLARITFDLPYHAPEFFEILTESCAAASQLAQLLLERRAVPRIRVEYFTNPSFNIGLSRSRKRVFEDNGTRGKDILSHGNFLPYLRYFIFGPALPQTIMDDFHRIAQSNPLDPSDDVEILRRLARSTTREMGAERRKTHEEFFKLSLECGLPLHYARLIRDAVRTAR